MEDAEAAEEAQPAPQSYLPSWVLKMREKIETSRTAHADAELRLEELNKGVDSLTLQLSKMGKHKALPKLSQTQHTQLRVSQEKIRSSADSTATRKDSALLAIPSEVFNDILHYLRLDQVIRLEMVSKAMRAVTSSCVYWTQALSYYCPHLVNDMHVRPQHAKATMQCYLRSVRLCVGFIQTMKDQRCVPKHRTVQPHRHSRHEKNVTHPLPLFQHSNSVPTSSSSAFLVTGGGSAASGSGTSQQSSYWGTSSQKEDLIMSHAETLSSDFRSTAHKSLQALLTLTTNTADPIFYKILGDGVVTVLASLLSNEEGALQNYACSVLANLLCWEARKRKLQIIRARRNGVAATGRQDCTSTVHTMLVLRTNRRMACCKVRVL
jgi:hypothetical protein